jgi:hypothetical protein
MVDGSRHGVQSPKFLETSSRIDNLLQSSTVSHGVASWYPFIQRVVALFHSLDCYLAIVRELWLALGIQAPGKEARVPRLAFLFALNDPLSLLLFQLLLGARGDAELLGVNRLADWSPVSSAFVAKLFGLWRTDLRGDL